DRLNAGPGVETEGKSRGKAAQQHRREIAETEPDDEQRRIGESRDRVADAYDRQEEIFRQAVATHGNAYRDAGERTDEKAQDQARNRTRRVDRKNAVRDQADEGGKNSLDLGEELGRLRPQHPAGLPDNSGDPA